MFELKRTANATDPILPLGGGIQSCHSALREGVKKNVFLGDLSQMWVGGVADSQTRSKPLKTPPNHPENRLFRPEFHLFFTSTLKYSWKNPRGRLAPRSAFRAEISMSGTSISRIPNHKPGQTDCNDLQCNNCHPMIPRHRCL